MLRNRKELDVTQLGGVILSADADELKPGRFTDLQNIVQSNVYSARKKRGVEILSTSSVSVTVPTACSGIPSGSGTPGGGGTVSASDPTPKIGGGSDPDVCFDVLEQRRIVRSSPQELIVDQWYEGSLTAVNRLNGTNEAPCNNGGGLLVDNMDITVLSGYGPCPDTGGGGMSIYYGCGVSGNDPDATIQAQYNGVVSGQPISGLALAVSYDATPCLFTGFVFLIDHVNTRTLVGYFVDGDLAFYSPSILATGSLPQQGNLDANRFTFEIHPGIGGAKNIHVENADGSIILDVSTSLVPGTIPNSQNHGLVWLGRQDNGTHSARWTITNSPLWALF